MGCNILLTRIEAYDFLLIPVAGMVKTATDGMSILPHIALPHVGLEIPHKTLGLSEYKLFLVEADFQENT